MDTVEKLATETRLLRTAARNWRTSSARRAGKLGRILAGMPTIDEVVAHMEHIRSIHGLCCAYCTVPVNFTTKKYRMNLDHALPVSRGGDASLSNLVVSCGPCNRAKGEMTQVEFKELRLAVVGWQDHGRRLFIRLRMGYFGR